MIRTLNYPWLLYFFSLTLRRIFALDVTSSSTSAQTGNTIIRNDNELLAVWVQDPPGNLIQIFNSVDDGNNFD